MNAENFRPLAPGTLVGRYRVLASVGSGAMGEVYRAEDTSLGRIVALKTLPGDLVGTPDRRARFENEGRVMASLSHANLVQVFDVGEHEGVPYLVQEFVEGETLEDVLLSGPVAAPKAARWIAQAAEGLISAHEAGILHRDIKPSNLMVGRDGRIRVLDFGLAKVQSPPEDRRRSQPSLTTEGLVVGTAQYMSPEQASGKKVDARSDIFSLGIVFYELLAGKAPFEGETAVGWLKKNGYGRVLDVVWGPLLEQKYGRRAAEVGLVWLWGKIALRTRSRDKSGLGERLGYLKGSFGRVVDALLARIAERGGEIRSARPVKLATRVDSRWNVEFRGGTETFDLVLSTVAIPDLARPRTA